MDDDVLYLVWSITMVILPPRFSRMKKSAYGMTYSGIFHLDEYFISAHLVESDGCKLEGCLWLRYDESLCFNICEGHVDILEIFV